MPSPRIRAEAYGGALGNLLWARRLNGDVFHITGDVHYLAMALPRRRVVLTICDLSLLKYKRGLARRLFKLMWYDWPVKWAEIVVAISDATKQDLLAACRVDERKVVVIPVCISETFQPRHKDFCQSQPRILQIGSGFHKNVERVIEALAAVPCHFHLIGAPSDAQRDALKRHGIPHTIEQNLSEAEIYRAYCECDIVSLVSTTEGFGMPIVEAQWVERPVVTSNYSSMPEVAGNAACFVDPFDVASIRRGFQRVIGDAEYRQRLVEEGRINRERFSTRTVTRQHLDVYQRVAAT